MAQIDSVSFGEIRIEGKTYYSDLIVWWDGKVEFVTKSHQFGMSELVRLLKKDPEAVIIGTGMEGAVEVLEEVEQKAEDRNLLFFQEKTPNALEIFNGMMAQKRKAVAWMHVTC